MSNTQSHLTTKNFEGSDSETESNDMNHLCVGRGTKRDANGMDKGRGKAKVREMEQEPDRDILEVELKKRKLIEGETSEVREIRVEPDEIIKHAKLYQRYMKSIQIPDLLKLEIPFATWQDLAQAIKILYKQPLHYLTNVLLEKWDHSRMGTKDDQKPMDEIIHPIKAEELIWMIESIHRSNTDYFYLAGLWVSHPDHQAFIDFVKE
ncbi:Protein RDM1, plant [Dillenia turbinata]|uniref:Protein RDM1, plant n=1 Tax=Dillenia turbinata TaxID=194707 RepID=A0AAN8ZCW5_9MAGN